MDEINEQKLTAVKTTAVSSTNPWTSGMSCAVTDCKISWPNPARENTVSVMTEPASKAPMVIPAMDSAAGAF